MHETRNMSDAPFSHSLQIQLRVLGALLMREVITRYGRDNLGFLWLFLEPMLFTGGVAAVWTVTRTLHTSNLSIIAFAVTGYSAVLLWRNCGSRCCMAIPPNVGLLYHRNVRVLDLFVTRILLEIAAATASFAVLSLAFIALGLMDWPRDPGLLLSGWLLLSWFSCSLGLVLGPLTTYAEVIERLWHTLTYLILPFSGSLFMVDWLPPSVREYALWSPMVSGVEMLRGGYYGSAVHAHYDAAYLAICSVTLTLVGLCLVPVAVRRVEIE
jgi:capsular polysaccharide transport system permease protein